ncbi:MAG: xanthine dehydrogenase family protein subunit M [Gemmatimonadota bacterium]
MGEIRDMMGTFELYQPMELDGALDLLRRHGSDAWVLGGGLDTFGWLKDRAKSTPVVVDLGGIAELRGIQVNEDGVRIGGLTSVWDVATHPDIATRFPVLARSAESVATPQIRTQGTIGGNVAQDTRCWYYRSGWPCYRAGGNTCYANAPGALNREHALFESSRCVAVTPSDVATALVALDAEMEIRTVGGTKSVRARDFFIGPAIDIRRMTALGSDEILTAITIPNTWASKPAYYEKVQDRKSWDFALANVASVLDVQGGVIQDARIVVGGVAARPLRMERVESAIRGRAINEATLEEAGRLAVQGARPLQYNAYKIALTRNLVKRAIREASA